MASNSSTIIEVPNDYGTIQEAINNANPGDIIYVYNGNYSESITINKTDLKIIGESKKSTIVDLSGGKNIRIVAGNTLIRGFTIKNASEYALFVESDDNVIYDNIFDFNHGGIYLGFLIGYTEVINNLIIENEILNSIFYGVYLHSACKNIIANNNFSNNNWAITLYRGSNNNVIDGNTILNSRGICINLSNSTQNIVSNNHLNSAGVTGIYVDYYSNYNNVTGNVLANIYGIWGIIYVINSFYNTIANNVLINNSAGIYLDHASHEILSNNTMIGNRYGIGVNGDILSHFMHSIDDSNKINGKPVYYIVNQERITVDLTVCPEAGFLGIVNSTDVEIRDLQITDNWHGILLAYTANSQIENVTVSRNHGGIDLLNSPNNTLTYNTISNNIYGIRITNLGSTIYKNNFINNSYQVQCSIQNLSWDNGAEGNFWSNHVGEDQNKDGIGDSPYIITANNQDNYPLISQASIKRIFHAGTWNQIPYHVIVFSNCTIAGFDFNQTLKQISFNVTGPPGKIGFCNVTIPKDLLDGKYEIWIGNDNRYFSLASNGTHNFLYFLHNCTTVNVRITGTIVIHEFATLLIFPIFMLLTLITILVKKLKDRSSNRGQSTLLLNC
jgi:parallel beta-helix repeat protein